MCYKQKQKSRFNNLIKNILHYKDDQIKSILERSRNR